MNVAHGLKVKLDKEYGSGVVNQLIAEVEALTGIKGVSEHRFHPTRKWRFDAAWQHEGRMIALELNGWTSHHRIGRMKEDNVKLAAAAIMGWRVLYATTDQCKKFGAIWVAQCLA